MTARPRLLRRVLLGAAAGAAGTTALNAVTYLDMALRGRPASSTPEDTVSHALDAAGLRLPGDEETRSNRLAGIAPLAGLATGVCVGTGYGVAAGLTGTPRTLPGGLLVGAAAMAGANGPMAVLGTSDPRAWSAADWASDVVPHVAYGLVTAFTYRAGAV
jgi:hypothetical protein